MREHGLCCQALTDHVIGSLLKSFNSRGKDEEDESNDKDGDSGEGEDGDSDSSDE